MMTKRVLVIGLDGATFDLIRPWVEEGRLPNLATLIHEGATANLQSTIPPITGPAWMSFATGRRPNNHKVFEFYYRDDNSYDIHPIDSTTPKGSSLWRILSTYGKRSIVINVPITYPAEEINGYIIAGLGAPTTQAPRFTHPVDLFEQKELSKGDYVITPPHISRYDGQPGKLFQDLKDMIKIRTDFALHLIQEEPWDFFMVHFYATDYAQHAFWHYMDDTSPVHVSNSKFSSAILNIFIKVDEAIGNILNTVENDTSVVVLSDHGFGPTHSYVNINNWLENISMLVTRRLSLLGMTAGICARTVKKWPGLGKITVVPFKYFTKFCYAALPFSARSRLDKVAFQFLSKSTRLAGAAGITTLHHTELIDWDNTKAYTIGTTGSIYINLKGREPRGIVNPGDEYEQVRDYIMKKFYQLRDNKGNKLVDKVYRKEDLYDGEFIEKAPDLIPVTESRICYFDPRLSAEGITAMPKDYRTGNHRLDGILIVKSPSVRSVAKLHKAHIWDVAPTILYLFGLPVPTTMDGKVLTELFHDSFLKENPIKFSKEAEAVRSAMDTMSTEEERRVVEQLRGLGYF